MPLRDDNESKIAEWIPWNHVSHRHMCLMHLTIAIDSRCAVVTAAAEMNDEREIQTELCATDEGK